MHASEQPVVEEVNHQEEQVQSYRQYVASGGRLHEDRYNSIVTAQAQKKEGMPTSTLVASWASTMTKKVGIPLSPRVEGIYEALYEKEAGKLKEGDLTGDQRIFAEALLIAGEDKFLKKFKESYPNIFYPESGNK